LPLPLLPAVACEPVPAPVVAPLAAAALPEAAPLAVSVGGLPMSTDPACVVSLVAASLREDVAGLPVTPRG
jgi:hypothetical protein